MLGKPRKQTVQTAGANRVIKRTRGKKHGENMGENKVREEDESSWREGQKANPRGIGHSRLSPQPASSGPHSEQHQKSYL